MTCVYLLRCVDDSLYCELQWANIGHTTDAGRSWSRFLYAKDDYLFVTPYAIDPTAVTVATASRAPA